MEIRKQKIVGKLKNNKIMKEVRVYLLDTDDTDATSYDIENWSLYAERHNSLIYEAENFLTECENIGRVYTLDGFQKACNLEDVDISNSYIFITNKY